MIILIAVFATNGGANQIAEPIPEPVADLPMEEKTSSNQEVDIGGGLFYDIRSSIFKLFQRVTDSLKSVFRTNVELYEEEREESRDYNIERNKNIKDSYLDNSEPPFDRSICPDSMPITEDTEFTFCSCGDGVCASYEDKCRCPRDCGSCPEDTICQWGECVEFIEGVCGNKVCEDDEIETCPWDCDIEVHEEEEEVLSSEEQDKVAERIRDNRIKFFKNTGMTDEQIDAQLANLDTDSDNKESLQEDLDE